MCIRDSNNIMDIKDLMDLANISRKTANKLLNTNDILTIKLGTLIKICKALKCDLSDLVEFQYEQKFKAK